MAKQQGYAPVLVRSEDRDKVQRYALWLEAEAEALESRD
jgi:hypothetical protein